MSAEKGSWGKVVGTIKDRLGLGPSRTEILEREVIPEIFALAGQTVDLSSLSSISQLAIPLPTDEREGKPKELKVASFTSLDLTNVIPNLERADGEEVTLADVLLALRNSAGKDKIQAARRNVPKIKERFHGQDCYVFTLNINGEPRNISYITRRGFVKGAGALSAGAILAACAGALFPHGSTPPQPTLPPPGSTIINMPEPPEAPPSPDLPLRLVNVADAVPAFKNARDNVSIGQTLNVISFGADTTQTPNPMDGQDTTYLQVTKRTDTSYLFDRVHADPNDQTPISPISIDIQPNSVNVGLPFGSSEKLVETNGMVQIPDMSDTKTFDFIRNAVGFPPASKLFFAGGNEGAELRGHAILFGEIDDANPTEVKSWVVMPWLTQKGVIATIGNKNGVPTIFFSGEGTGDIELSKLLVKMDKKSTVVVSPDGKYIINYGNGGFEPLAKFLRVNGVPENIISYYENLFIPPVLNEPWASNKETLQVQPENIFPIIGGVNHANRYALDMAMGSMKLVVKQSLDLTLTANHDGIRGTLGLALDNNAEFKAQAMKVRANIASTDDFKGSKDYSDLTLVVEAGIVTMAVLKVDRELKRFKVDPDGTITLLKKEEEPNLLPELRVNGPFIERADTGEHIQFKGIDLYIPERKSGESVLSFVERNVEANKKLGIKSNIVKLAFDTKGIINPPSMVSDISDAVDYLEKKGIYVILSPAMINGAGSDLPTDDVTNAISMLASHQKYNSNVLYQIWNEPAEVSWTSWNVWINKISSAILENFNGKMQKPIIVVSGTKWARDFRGADISLQNYVVDVHDYRWDGTNVRNWWTIMIGRVPVIISELAGFNPSRPGQVPYQSPEDVIYIQDTFDTIINATGNENKVHYLFWRGEDSGDGLRTRSGGLTPRGVKVFNEQKSHPTMTDFTE